jgi:hypothetical protein
MNATSPPLGVTVVHVEALLAHALGVVVPGVGGAVLAPGEAVRLAPARARPLAPAAHLLEVLDHPFVGLGVGLAGALLQAALLPRAEPREFYLQPAQVLPEGSLLLYSAVHVRPLHLVLPEVVNPAFGLCLAGTGPRFTPTVLHYRFGHLYPVAVRVGLPLLPDLLILLRLRLQTPEPLLALAKLPFVARLVFFYQLLLEVEGTCLIVTWARCRRRLIHFLDRLGRRLPPGSFYLFLLYWDLKIIVTRPWVVIIYKPFLPSFASLRKLAIALAPALPVVGVKEISLEATAG